MDVNTKFLTQENMLRNNFLVENVNDENINPELHQYCKSKISTLEHFVEHLNNELSKINLQHIEDMINNIKHMFTIIDDIESSQHKRQCKKTLKESKPWTLFMQYSNITIILIY
ncbi:5506_t:CDS:1 [Cetraspora pellucida]|uniref:5506_t:CDS:1 n=1 Tax=Cetraspora pellucida TaxID=1433469 RepID=A0ACA9KVK5_9GLOM|nr:5506_t:CDS:1 [Cetraspora pellucida]